MNSTASSLRYERKFISREHTLAEVLSIVRRHPALFREAYPARCINNIYFDTPGMRDYHDHVTGVAERIKTRIRWYGPRLGEARVPALERKGKRGLVGSKQGYELAPFCFVGEMLGNDFQRLFDRATLPGDLKVQMLYRRPTLVTRYHRRYFLSADRLFRLTLDTEMEFYRIGTAAGRLTSAVPSVPSIIMELKYGCSSAERVGEITSHIPFRVERCSKYILGLQSTSFI